MQCIDFKRMHMYFDVFCWWNDGAPRLGVHSLQERGADKIVACDDGEVGWVKGCKWYDDMIWYIHITWIHMISLEIFTLILMIIISMIIILVIIIWLENFKLDHLNIGHPLILTLTDDDLYWIDESFDE